jgi:hypothetical protein
MWQSCPCGHGCPPLPRKILVLDSYSGEDIMREEPVITVNWVTEGFDCCRVGFLPCPYVPDAAIYNGVLCQVTEMFEKNVSSRAISKKWGQIKGLRAR